MTENNKYPLIKHPCRKCVVQVFFLFSNVISLLSSRSQIYFIFSFASSKWIMLNSFFILSLSLFLFLRKNCSCEMDSCHIHLKEIWNLQHSNSHRMLFFFFLKLFKHQKDQFSGNRDNFMHKTNFGDCNGI